MIDYKIRNFKQKNHSRKGTMVVYEGKFQGELAPEYVRKKKLTEIEFDIHAEDFKKFQNQLNKLLKKHYPKHKRLPEQVYDESIPAFSKKKKV